MRYFIIFLSFFLNLIYSSYAFSQVDNDTAQLTKIEQQARTYFTNEQYERSKKLFLKLDEQHPNNPDYIYNLGLIAYQLGKYTEAKKYFSIVKNNKNDNAISYFDISTYYLAVISYVEGNQQAQQQITTLSNSNDLETSILASDFIDLIELVQDKPVYGNTTDTKLAKHVYINLGVANSDGFLDLRNPDEIFDDQSDISYKGLISAGADYFDLQEYRFAASFYAFTEKHIKLTNYNVALIGFKHDIKKSLGIYQINTELGYNKIWLNGSPYTSQWKIGVTETHPLRYNNLKIESHISYMKISAQQSIYSGYTGNKQQFNIQLSPQPSLGRLFWQLKYEINNSNLADSTGTVTVEQTGEVLETFTSLSQLDHNIEALFEWQLYINWSLHFSTGYSYEKNKSSNTFLYETDDTFLSALGRKSSNYNFSTALMWAWHPKSRIKLEYNRNSNNANIDNYDYTNNVITVGFDYQL